MVFNLKQVHVCGRKMARHKKLSDAEKKIKKKEYDRKRRENMKNNTESSEKLREMKD